MLRGHDTRVLHVLSRASMLALGVTVHLSGLDGATARAQGAMATGVHANEFSLLKIRPPAVAWVAGHFIAVLTIAPQGARDEVVIHDPDRMSEQTMSREQLLTVSKGYLLVVGRMYSVSRCKLLGCGARGPRAIQLFRRRIGR